MGVLPAVMVGEGGTGDTKASFGHVGGNSPASSGGGAGDILTDITGQQYQLSC